MERVEKNIKSKLFDLYEEYKILNDTNRYWFKENGGLSRKDRILKNQIEIDILEKMLKP